VLLQEISRGRAAAFDRQLATRHYLRFDQKTRDIVRRNIVLACAARENAKPGDFR